MARPEGTSNHSGTMTQRGAIARFLDLVERIGNRLPDQATIFIMLALATMLLSWLTSALGWSIVHPVTGAKVEVFNLASKDGLQWIFGSVVTNFTGFPPLGTVLVAMIGVGIAERVGLFAALLKALVTAVPRAAITPTIVFAGIMSNVASDAGYVILPPLAAMLYASLGRHPIAGIAAAFSGISAGFSANLMLSSLDPMLSDLTQKAAQLFDLKYEVFASCNFYFMAASVPLLVLVGWFVSDKIVEPRMGKWNPQDGDGAPPVEFAPLTSVEKRGLVMAGLAILITFGAIVLLVLPEEGILRDADRTVKPFYRSLVALIMIVFIVPGIVYGVVTRSIRSDRDAAKMMSQTMAAMGGYVMIAFFAGQFIFWFGKSNLGFIIAIEGAALLKSINLTGLPLMIGFVLVVAVFNIVMSSASAKWAILSPVFVPMMMALGMSPESTQAFYRVGDSVTNVITPLNVYLPILLGFAHRYQRSAGLGTLIAAMLPYSIAFFIAWVVALGAWAYLGLPIGPGASLDYTMPVAAG
jgi:aminobenzoyl-glutamate transport protein